MPPTNPVPLDRYRDFDDFDVPTEQPTFKLGGEEFTCLAMPPGGVLTRLAAAISRDERGRQVYNLPDMNLFIEDCLITERIIEPEPIVVDADAEPDETPEPVAVIENADERERWRALMDDPKRPIPIRVVADVVIFLQNWYSKDSGARPTRPSGR
jgi:hypothetical protein